ncbi:inactive ubiquitin carboxyl-terminal hydrolase MINDY-4B isoform X2 [Protopterus annectens]|uniref:inactive ubiquitin carboxyl-terminal hydrolase MINDY-4B isoform X2 n=1 Tax=Protopterus annectens TaxID=7888 RepID=UPI001CF9A9DE|nr:inactive ubiquitin carboxyl-terminal hydrolase MINDY-4B isoform X2 [Protopterus annectens]
MEAQPATTKEHGLDADLDVIASKISELEKWKDIFSAGRLELVDTDNQKYPDKKSEDGNEDGTGAPQTGSNKNPGHFPSTYSPYSLPKPLSISSDLGGLPITLEMAMELRKILFGSAFHTFNYEWKKSYFSFHEPYSELSYALQAERGGARAIQMVVQAHVIKQILFGTSKEENSSLQSLQAVSQKEQEKALAAALADILWAARDGEEVTVCLVTTDICFTPSRDYKVDNFTEKLLLFNFCDKDAIQTFIVDHIHFFKTEGSHGVILFLYSALFSRTFKRLQEDFGCTVPHLLKLNLGNFTCRQAVLNLMLTGRASPYVFNGDLQYDEQGGQLMVPMHGILNRSDVGYLYWNREEMEQGRLSQVGSMLKTPRLPIWLCNINGTFSVLYSTNRSLLSDWKMEHLFDLHFYNGQQSQNKTVTLTIDTQSHHWEERQQEDEGDIEKRFPSLEMTIRTKWDGAVIDWHGTVPFF